MKVFDLVRELNNTKKIKDVIVHGVFKGYIEKPQSYRHLTEDGSGYWALVDVYGMTFLDTNMTYFSGVGSIVTYVERGLSLVNAPITLYGRSLNTGSLGRQSNLSKKNIGYCSLSFKSQRNAWVVVPSKVTAYSYGKYSKELDSLFSEGRRFGYVYPEVAKSVLSFSGDYSYNFYRSLNVTEPKTVDVKSYRGISPELLKVLEKELIDVIMRRQKFLESLRPTKSSSPIPFGKMVEGFENKLEELENTKIPVLNYSVAQFLKRTQFTSGTTNGIDYLINFCLENPIENIENSKVTRSEFYELAFSNPYALHFLCNRGIWECDNLFYLTRLFGLTVDITKNIQTRKLAILNSFLVNSYLSGGSTLVSSLEVSRGNLQLPEYCYSRYQSSRSFFKKENILFLRHLLGDRNPYNTVFSGTVSGGGYYLKDLDMSYLKKLDDFGIAIDVDDNFISTDYFKEEIEIYNTIFSMSKEEYDLSIDFMDGALNAYISKGYYYNSEIRESLYFLLRRRFGCLVALKQQNYEDVLKLMGYLLGERTGKPVHLISRTIFKPSWVEGTEFSWICWDSLKTQPKDYLKDSIVFVVDAHLFSREYGKLFEYLKDSSYAYLVGSVNSSSSSSTFRGIVSKSNSFRYKGYKEATPITTSLESLGKGFNVEFGSNIKMVKERKALANSFLKEYLKLLKGRKVAIVKGYIVRYLPEVSTGVYCLNSDISNPVECYDSNGNYLYGVSHPVLGKVEGSKLLLEDGRYLKIADFDKVSNLVSPSDLDYNTVDVAIALTGNSDVNYDIPDLVSILDDSRGITFLGDSSSILSKDVTQGRDTLLGSLSYG